MKQLENIKVEDKIIVHYVFEERVETVSKVTKTLIIVGDCRFNKNNGFTHGRRGYNFPYIVRVM